MCMSILHVCVHVHANEGVDVLEKQLVHRRRYTPASMKDKTTSTSKITVASSRTNTSIRSRHRSGARDIATCHYHEVHASYNRQGSVGQEGVGCGTGCKRLIDQD